MFMNLKINDMEKFEHLMLDIETMGSESYSSILSIGAVKFNIFTGETSEEFYVKIDLASCTERGLVINAETLKWWMSQDDKAKTELFEGELLKLEDALLLFSNFCNKNYQIWGNSARFDCGILQNAYNRLKIPIPWDFRKERCLRTLVSFSEDVKKNANREGVEHNALHDCYHQIKYCCDIFNKLKF